MKPGPAASALATSGSRHQIRGEARGESARIRAGSFGFARIDHRRIGREIAVSGVAGRLDDEAAKVEIARQISRRDPFLKQPDDARLEVRENVH